MYIYVFIYNSAASRDDIATTDIAEIRVIFDPATMSSNICHVNFFNSELHYLPGGTKETVSHLVDDLNQNKNER